jgi:hypothetical protein
MVHKGLIYFSWSYVVEIQILVIFCDERKLYLNIWSLFFLSKLMRVMHIYGYFNFQAVNEFSQC